MHAQLSLFVYVTKIGRNEACPCGSGKKYKKCCLAGQPAPDRERAARAMRMMQAKIPGPFDGPDEIKVDFAGHRIRVIGSTIFPRPQRERHHEWLMFVLQMTIGRNWLERERAKPHEEQHVIARWLEEAKRLKKEALPVEGRDGLISAHATGGAKEAILLALDLYSLQLAHRLPGSIRKRLKDPKQFQGARYEIAIAGALVRAGFEIEWVVDKSTRHCEFLARHKTSGESVAVETKSRHRAGTLNEAGTFDEEKATGAMKSLLADALGQAPNDRPYFVFVDVNLPPVDDLSEAHRRWGEEALMTAGEFDGTADIATPFTAVVFTNFSWHYAGSNVAGRIAPCAVRPMRYARFLLQSEMTWQAIQHGLNTLAIIPPDKEEP